MAITFLKGRAAHEALKRDKMQAEARAAARGLRRFWVPHDKEAVVTFLDGALTSEGLLDTTSYNEHRLFLNGNWRNYYPCTAATEPCPLCAQDNNPTLVSLFTVIDHSKWEDRSGKVHRHERKLFVAKRETFARLQKLATKRGGLKGWRVAISRTGERSPEVGSDFDFLEKHNLKELGAKLKLPPEGIKPFDYEKDIKVFTADELIELGFGVHVVGQQDTTKLRQAKRRSPVVQDDDEDDDVFTSKPARPVEEDEDEDVVVLKKRRVKQTALDDEDEVEDEPEEEDEDEDDLPPPAKKAVKKLLKKRRAEPVEVEEADEDSDEDDL